MGLGKKELAGTVRWLKSNSLSFLEGVAAILTAAGGIYLLVKGTSDLPSLLLVIFICAGFTTAWGLLILQEYRYSRKARYAEAMEDVHQAYHKLRDAWFYLIRQQPDDLILEKVQESLTSLASAFGLVTGVHCRVCVKELLCPDANITPKKRALRVRTMARSQPAQEPQESDWVDKNTDFERIFTKPKEDFCNCFFSNNLPKEDGYQNSHWTEDIWKKRDFPYVSTIVWPIRKVLASPVPELGSLHPEHDCLGFLCVDSKARGAFRKRFDFPLGAGYADALYALLKSRRQKSPSSEHTENSNDTTD